jgi:Na+-driven multidrug efflux pump
VPARGIFGAAIATVITEVVVTVGCACALWRLKAEDRRPKAAVIGKPHAAL